MSGDICCIYVVYIMSEWCNHIQKYSCSDMNRNYTRQLLLLVDDPHVCTGPTNGQKLEK